MYSCQCDPCLIIFCTRKDLLQQFFILRNYLFISPQLTSKFTFTCRIDLTVFSERLFLSLVHCAKTRENTRSTNALLTGMEKTMLISL